MLGFVGRCAPDFFKPFTFHTHFGTLFAYTEAQPIKTSIMRTTRRNIYSVDWYRGDFCYRTTTGCTWENVQECRRSARLLGEKIKYEVIDVKDYRY